MRARKLRDMKFQLCPHTLYEADFLIDIWISKSSGLPIIPPSPNIILADGSVGKTLSSQTQGLEIGSPGHTYV